MLILIYKEPKYKDLITTIHCINKRYYVITITFNSKKKLLNLGGGSVLEKANKQYYQKFQDILSYGMVYLMIHTEANKQHMLNIIEFFAKQNKIKVQYISLKEMNDKYINSRCKKGGKDKKIKL